MGPELYLHFWGKARGEREGEPAWHPVAYHNLDVAAVADVLLRANPRRLKGMAAILGVDADAARHFLVKLIALHDIGKFSTAFQAKVPELYPKHLKPHVGSTDPRHDQIAWLLRDVVEDHLGTQLRDWRGSDFGHIWGSVAGHHGKPQQGEAKPNPSGMTSLPSAAMHSFINECLALFPDQTQLPQRRPQELATLSWAVAGLAVLADWIGSNRDWFPYCLPEHSLADYWDYACGKAEDAVIKAGVLPSAAPSQMNATRLLPARIATALSPLQSFAETVDLATGPMLAIIEDVTGSGKTEAALLLAARLMAAGRASGIFVALPTMATANAMYDRLGAIYRKLFADDETPSLVLAHGRTDLHPGFTKSILPSTAASGAKSDGEVKGDESSAACAAFIADSRRKAFLADVGIGTIDQALLGVLPSKFQSLRLWGLADRVLVIDEAHAYDAYMGREIETLLEFHAALGGSAIILSATLPHTQRNALAAAFGRGLGLRLKSEETTAYPLATLVSQASCTQHPVETRVDRTRNLAVRWIAQPEEAIAHILEASAKGGAVAWIRNSVDDAIEASEALKLRGLTPILLHARFAMGHRLDIEGLVTSTLGRIDSQIDQSRRRGFVLVGTQILEQSLDYDVDAMITDLAPIDLMIQRAGRLWRHMDRTDRRPFPRPELLVLSPDPARVNDANWYGQVSKRAAAVYDHHGVVWRSAKKLFDVGKISTPGGVRELVEAVYGGGSADDDIPEPLRHRTNNAVGKNSAARATARSNVLSFASGYAGGENQTNWTSDTITPTRLGDPVTVFRLGTWDGQFIVPIYGQDSSERNWALSEVSVSQRKATGVLTAANAKTERAISLAKENWPKWEQDLPMLVLTPEGTEWYGTVTKDGTTALRVRYGSTIGFRFT